MLIFFLTFFQILILYYFIYGMLLNLMLYCSDGLNTSCYEIFERFMVEVTCFLCESSLKNVWVKLHVVSCVEDL